MGCTHSKLDDLPAVALCRERCTFLDEAIHQRYALAEAHLAYLQSLRNVGITLHRFFDGDLDSYTAEPVEPVLNLPAQRKGDPQPSGSPKKHTAVAAAAAAAAAPSGISHHHHHSHSDSGSHLKFHSESEDDDSAASGSLHHEDHSEASSPIHQYGHMNYAVNESFGLPGPYPGGGGGFMHMNYMRNQMTPSVTYQHRPMNSETAYMGEASSSYYPYPYAPNNQNSNFYPHYNYDNYGGGFPGSSPPQMMPPYFGSSSPPRGIGTSMAASTSKEPPPPPPPASSSTWDFLNPFETYYPPYTPSRDSREVREEEGIPELEEEDYQQEVVKEVHGNQKFVDNNSDGARANYSKAALEVEDEKEDNSEALYRARPSVGVESDPVEYEVHIVDKKVVADEDRSGARGNTAGFKPRGGFKGDSDVVREIQALFERASESGNELAKILEVGKLPHNRKHAAYLGITIFSFNCMT